MNSLAQRLCSFRVHHVSLYPLNVCKKDARADQQCLLGFVLLQLKIQQLEDLDFMFVLRKERCLRLSTTACEERTGGKGYCSYEPEALLAHREDNRPGQEREDLI